jgi:hypothetical protein
MCKCLITAPKRMNEHFEKRYCRGNNTKLAGIEIHKEWIKKTNVVRVFFDVVDKWRCVHRYGLAVELL